MNPLQHISSNTEKNSQFFRNITENQQTKIYQSKHSLTDYFSDFKLNCLSVISLILYINITNKSLTAQYSQSNCIQKLKVTAQRMRGISNPARTIGCSKSRVFPAQRSLDVHAPRIAKFTIEYITHGYGGKYFILVISKCKI